MVVTSGRKFVWMGVSGRFAARVEHGLGEGGDLPDHFEAGTRESNDGLGSDLCLMGG
jgi:hypothetical protein